MTAAIPAVPADVLDAIVKAYDIRGLCPEQLDPPAARALGAAFAGFCGRPQLVLGRDMRASGVELAAAFAEGATAVGVDVVDIGLASTDLLYFASGRLDMPGAMLTASHNPARYNGIKLCGRAAAPIGADSGLADIAAAAASDIATLPPERRGRVSRRDLLEQFVEHVRSFVRIDDLAPLRVVADTANGMGGHVAPAVFDGLALRVELLYPELDGTFPNHPADPMQPENLADLRAAVTAAGADVGLAFDGDADRVFLVDEKANPVSGSLTTALVATGTLAREGPGPILHNLVCSRAVPEAVVAAGGTPVRTRVGHSYIKAAMAQTGAAFGGEHSGHYYFARNFRADSGLIAALVVLEQLSRADVPLSQLLAPFDRYANLGETNIPTPDPTAMIERAAAHYAAAEPGLAQDRLDGLTVEGADWWFNLRPSNTEPLLRLNLEADDAARLEQRRGELTALLEENEQRR
ncbi:MAG TPA: phosphomannomutase/phosphoglucomutase [Acidimicrobiaceae bacterium]|nr:phosphomannomutase/phosphoglucomutase [Acidimicrobiaceae bacterium]HCB36855.1 phosphomannomutase/phosphoglucomutase [Acidimicrobiaceae bacterium]